VKTTQNITATTVTPNETPKEPIGDGWKLAAFRREYDNWDRVYKVTWVWFR
jgi:hypothetical protein